MIESISEIVCAAAVFCFLVVGCILHSQIFKTAKREKDITWKLDATNSCFVMIHYIQYTSMHLITYVIKDLYIYTGAWFCYVSTFVTYYGGWYVQAHSLIIGLLKYFIIVHWKRTREFGQRKVKTIFFWLNMLHPCIMIILWLIIYPDFFFVWDGYSHVDRCLGDPKHNLLPNSNATPTKIHNICIEIVANPPENNIDYIVYICRSSLCWVQFVFSYFVLWNIFEIFVYFFIFRFMQRYVSRTTIQLFTSSVILNITYPNSDSNNSLFTLQANSSY